MSQQVETFRSSFWWVLGYVLLLVGAIGLPAVGVELLILTTIFPPLTPDQMLVIVGIAVAVGEAFAFVAVFALVCYFKVYVSPQGLRSYNAWCLYRTVAWADITSVRPMNMLGLKYVRVYTTSGGSPLWLPMFLRDRERFHELVIEYAGADHPLALALHEVMS